MFDLKGDDHDDNDMHIHTEKGLSGLSYSFFIYTLVVFDILCYTELINRAAELQPKY